VNILPEDVAGAAALRAELNEKRGGVHLEVGRFVPAEPSALSETQPSGGTPAFTPSAEWAALSPADGLDFLALLLSRPSAPGGAAIPRGEAESFAARVSALFSDRARFFKSADSGLAVANGAHPVAPTDSMLDTSLFILDGDRAGLLWVEADE
jgi:hypothetical protein